MAAGGAAVSFLYPKVPPTPTPPPPLPGNVAPIHQLKANRVAKMCGTITIVPVVAILISLICLSNYEGYSHRERSKCHYFDSINGRGHGDVQLHAY